MRPFSLRRSGYTTKPRKGIPSVTGCGRGANQPPLWLVNVKRMIAPGLILPVAQLLLQLNQVIFEAILEAGRSGAPALTLGRHAVGQIEVFPRM